MSNKIIKGKKGKVKTDIDDDGLDIGDMPDFDSPDFGDDSNFNDRKPSITNTSKELAKEAGSGFLDSVIKKTAAKSLPDEYADNYYEVADYAGFVSDTFQTSKSKINKAIYGLGKEIKKILPIHLGVLDKYLTKFESDYENQRTESEEAMRDAGIQSNISSIFDKQLDIQKAIEGKRSAEREIDKKQDFAVTKANLDILASIDSNISSQTAFTLQINKEYFRKSLELQYKVYYIQADMLKTTRDYYKGFSIQFDSIVKNTGLPDYVKLSLTENLKDIARKQTTEGFYKQMFNQSDYVKRVKDKMSRIVSDKVNGITDSISNATSLLEGVNSIGEMNGGSGMGAISGIAASTAGGAAGEYVADKVSPKFRDKIKDNKYVRSTADMLALLTKSPESFFSLLREKMRNVAEDNVSEDSPGKFLVSKAAGAMSGLLEATKLDAPDLSVKNQSILDHNKPAMFDNKVHRSITEVIPMFLGKILAENTSLRKMYSTVNDEKMKKLDHSPNEKDELVYNYHSRKLTTVDKYKDDIKKTLFNKDLKNTQIATGTTEKLSGLATAALKNDSDAKKVLNNKKNKEAFTNYLAKASKELDEDSLNIATLVKDTKDKKGEDGITRLVSTSTNPEIKKKLDTFLAEDSKLQEYIQQLKKAEVDKTTPDINESIKEVKRDYPILGVIELFKYAGILANGESKAQVIHKLLPKEATILAKAFIDFRIGGFFNGIRYQPDVVTSTNIMNAKCFIFLSNKDYNSGSMKEHIDSFISDVKLIKATNDMIRVSALERYIGALNFSLTNVNVVDISLYKNLNELSSLVQPTGNIGREQMYDGTLGVSDKTGKDMVDYSELRKLGKNKHKDVVIRRQKSIVDALTSNLNNSSIVKQLFKSTAVVSAATDAFKNEVGSNGIKGAVSAVKKYTSTLGGELKANAHTAYSSAQKTLEKTTSEITKSLDNLAKDNLKVFKEKMLANIDANIDALTKLIEAEAKAQQDIVAINNTARQIVNDDIDTKGNIDKVIDKLNISSDKIHKYELKALNKAKVKLIAIRKSIDAIDTEANVTTVITTIKTTWGLAVKDIRDTLDEIKTNIEKQESIADSEVPA